MLDLVKLIYFSITRLNIGELTLSHSKQSIFCLTLDGEHLNLEDLEKVARHTGYSLSFSKEALQKMKHSRSWVDSIQEHGRPIVYGINTGFGSKASVSIDIDNLKDLQRNLIMSHAAGTGQPFPIDVVRAAMIIRVNTFAKGYSGVRLLVGETLIKMLEMGVTPWIPEQGSLGASGDLAPLSHLALVLSRGVERDLEEDSGSAYFFDNDKNEWGLISGKLAMEKAGIPRIVLEAKEGLALNNGTQISTAVLALALEDAKKLIKQADIAMAMSLEALEGISSAFREEVHQLRPYKGQIQTAENIRKLTKGSQLLDRHARKIQDAYSLRCYPQVMGAIRETIAYLENTISVEMNSTTDNPIIFPDLDEENKAISGGNFHAQPIAFAADILSMILCEVGSISERRIFRLSDKNLNQGLPSFLIQNSGFESGLMLAQYTAAALVAENRAFVHPASVDSIPTCENQEDHVSMAPIAARKAALILANVQKIVAIETFYSAQALDLRLKDLGKVDNSDQILGKGTLTAYKKIRENIPFIDKDRPIYRHLEKALNLIKNCEILQAVEDQIGKLN